MVRRRLSPPPWGCVALPFKLVDEERRVCEMCFVGVLIDYVPVLLDQALSHVHIVFCRANMKHFWSRASSVWSEQAASGMVCLRRCQYRVPLVGGRRDVSPGCVVVCASVHISARVVCSQPRNMRFNSIDGCFKTTAASGFMMSEDTKWLAAARVKTAFGARM